MIEYCEVIVSPTCKSPVYVPGTNSMVVSEETKVSTYPIVLQKPDFMQLFLSIPLIGSTKTPFAKNKIVEK